MLQGQCTKLVKKRVDSVGKMKLRKVVLNSSVLRQCLNNVSDGTDMTEEGGVFQARTAATGNAQSPSVDRDDWNHTISDSQNITMMPIYDCLKISLQGT